MALGDIVSLAVRADGWSADLTVEGFGVGSTFNPGTGVENALTGMESVVLSVTSMGFDTNGNAITRTRRVVGIAASVRRIVRQPWPNNAVADETPSAGNLVIRIALSEPVFAKDKAGSGNSGTDIVATVWSGAVTNAGGVQQSNSRVGFAATNNSTLAYPRVVGRWAWNPRDRVTGDFLVEAICLHRFAQWGQPVACVQFDATDGTTPISTITVREMRRTPRTGDYHAVATYHATIPTAGFATNTGITCQFRAFPWIGDSAAVIDSRVGADGTAPLTERLSPFNVFLDRLDNRAVYASVQVGAVGGTAQLTPALARTTPFPTIAAAMTALRALNNTQNGRNTLDACVILMQPGSYTGPGTFTGSNALSWCVIRADTENGATVDNVIINAGTNTACNAWLKVEGLTITGSAAGILRGNTTTGQLCLFRNKLSATAVSAWWSWTVAFGVQNIITAASTAGFSGTGVTRCPFALVRGNDGSSLTVAMPATAYCFMGNRGLKPAIQEQGNSFNHAISDNAFVIWSSAMGMTGSGGPARWISAGFQNTTITHGFYMMACLAERISSTEPLVQIFGDSSTAPGENVVVAHCSFIGQRCNTNYLEYGTTNVARTNWAWRFNLTTDWNCKTDTFVDGPPNGVRVLNWAFMHGNGCGYSVTAVSNFPMDSWAPRFAVTGSNSAMGFVDDRSAAGSNTGNGNYYLTAASPGRNRIPVGGAMIPIDLAGNPYGNNGDGSAGAYQRTEDLMSSSHSFFFAA